MFFMKDMYSYIIQDLLTYVINIYPAQPQSHHYSSLVAFVSAKTKIIPYQRIQSFIPCQFDSKRTESLPFKPAKAHLLPAF